MTPRDAAKLRILDPACGSGSFLVGAYQYLLTWHRDWYVSDGVDKHDGKEIYQGKGGQWYLTTEVKRKILLNNIYGVDIDAQAVEVTKLSLLLKVLEDESQETLEKQRRLFHERALPDLGSNIKCGNSLIGPDFYQDRQGELFDEETRAKINAFDWNAEFAKIMKAGGFDVVIGNPPWGQKEIADEQGIKDYIWDRYSSSKGIYDLFRPFIEKGIQLVRRDGAFGMVLPDIVLLKDYVETRKYILERLRLEAIDWWGMAFADAVIDAATIVGSGGPPNNGQLVRVTVHDPESPISQVLKQADFWTNPRFVFNLHLTPEKRCILQKLEKYPRLGDFFEVHEGVHSGNIREDLFVERAIDKSSKPLIFGRDEIQPYQLSWNGKFVRLSALPKQKTRERYANAGSPTWHEQQKLLVRRTGDHVLAAVDDVGRYASNNFFLVFPKAQYALNLHGLCALLNSPLMTWYFRTIEPRCGRAFAELKIKHLSAFPLPVAESAECKKLNDLGAARAKVAASPAKATPHESQLITRNAQQLDKEIARLVSRLFEIEETQLEDSSSPERRPHGTRRSAAK